MNEHEALLREQAYTKSRKEISDYMDDCFGQRVSKEQFWEIAKNKFKPQYDSLIRSKNEIEEASDTQQYLYKTNVFTTKSKDLIRRVAIQIKILK